MIGSSKDSINILKRFTQKRYSGPWSANLSDLVRIKILLRLVGIGKKVLDIGCYDGSISVLYKNEGRNDVEGVDISEHAVELAKQKGIKAQVADLENGLPFPDAFFDVVVAGEVIEHVLNIDFLLDEIKRVLKPRGFIVITTPNLASLGRRILLLFGRNPLIETRWTEGAAGHVRYFIKDSLFELMRVHGFIIDDFCSDIINFDNTGRFFSTKLAKLFPTFGKSLVIKAHKGDLK